MEKEEEIAKNAANTVVKRKRSKRKAAEKNRK
jgi:hypothetical protein